MDDKKTDDLLTALREILNVLGTGNCSENKCPGCLYETQEAIFIAKTALSEIEAT